MAFKNPAPAPAQAVGVDTQTLLIPGIQSDNYSPGVAGWRIARDGNADFAGTVSATGQIVRRDGIQSDNYSPGVAGWRIARDGNADFAGIVKSNGAIAGRDGIQSNDWAPGYLGYGWRLETGTEAGGSSVTADGVVIRNEIRSLDPEFNGVLILDYMVSAGIKDLRTQQVLWKDRIDESNPYGYFQTAYPQIVSTDDYSSLNQMNHPGRWEIQSNAVATALADTPVNAGGILYVETRNNKIRILQRYETYSTSQPRVYHRYSDGTNWSSWRQSADDSINDLTTQNLNGVIPLGRWMQNSAANATLANNYPLAGVLGLLTVEGRDNGTRNWQTYLTAQTSPRLFVRYGDFVNNNINPWVEK